MNDPIIYVVVILVCGICGVAAQQVISRIRSLEKNSAGSDDVKRLDAELSAVRDQISSIDSALRKSADEFRDTFVCKDLCAAKQEKLELNIANIIKSWELDRMDNKKDHEGLSMAMEKLLAKVSEQSDCLTKIAAGISCD